MLTEGLRIEYRTDKSQKFWEPRVQDKEFSVRFGKIGTEGQERTKQLPSPEKALSEYQKLIREKLSKGYKPTEESIITLLANLEQPSSPKAIAALDIGEHTEENVVEDVCRWMTMCLHSRLDPKQFTKIWEKTFEEEAEDLFETLGTTRKPDDYMFWTDTLGNIYSIPDTYSTAFKRGADRIVWAEHDAFYYLVATKGIASKQDIWNCVYKNTDPEDMELDLGEEELKKELSDRSDEPKFALGIHLYAK